MVKLANPAGSDAQEGWARHSIAVIKGILWRENRSAYSYPFQAAVTHSSAISGAPLVGMEG